MAAVAAAMTMAGPDLRADVYDVDAAHTHIGFAVKHMMVTSVRGNFQKFAGTVEYDGADVTSLKASAKIEAASIDTDNADRDKHLKSADFFDVEKFPEIAFESTKVEKSGDGAVLHGKLTIRGVAKEIAIPVEVNGPVVNPWGATVIGFTGSAKINRKDFGLTWNKALDKGGVAVGDEVKLDLAVEAIKRK
jgi:polyisoprenoid-binding protein YceI